MSLVCFAEYNRTYANMKFWYGLVVYSGRIMFCLSACLLRSFTSLLSFLTAGRQLPYDVQSWPPSFGPSSLQHHESWCFGPLHTQNQEVGPKMDGPLDYCNRSFSFWKPACSGSILVCKDFWLMFYLSSYFFKYGDGTSWKFNGWQIHFAYGTGHRILPLHG